jgi:hypothetical protein
MSRSSKKHIPTLLGIFILIFGIASGVILLNAKQIFKLGAKEDTEPKNFRVSNISDDSFTISFITPNESSSFIKIGADRYFLGETQILRQTEKNDTHYYDIKNLLPEKEYFVYLNTNGVDYFLDEPKTIKTGVKLGEDINSQILYGKVYSESGEELEGAIVYLQSGNDSLLSTKTANDGGFALTASRSKSADLTSYEKIDPDKTLIQILVQHGLLTSSVTTYLKNAQPLPPIILGNNQDVRNSISLPANVEISSPKVFGSSTNPDEYPFLFKSIYKLP